MESYFQGGFDGENVNTGEVISADWRSDSSLLPLELPQGRSSTVMAKEIRLKFCSIFMMLELCHGKKMQLIE